MVFLRSNIEYSEPNLMCYIYTNTLYSILICYFGTVR